MTVSKIVCPLLEQTVTWPRELWVFHGIPELGYADACLPGKL
jgi:hypothetical protein